MSQQVNTDGVQRHPIEVISIAVKELSIQARKPPDISLGVENNKFFLATGATEYDEETHSIMVGVKIEVGLDEKEDAPFTMKIELVGEFKVDETRFPIEHVDDWAKRNAIYILMPYVREQAYALTAKCGYRPMLIPLTQVPMFSIKKEPSPLESQKS